MRPVERSVRDLPPATSAVFNAAVPALVGHIQSDLTDVRK
jgi:hypothetical protein